MDVEIFHQMDKHEVPYPAYHFIIIIVCRENALLSIYTSRKHTYIILTPLNPTFIQ